MPVSRRARSFLPGVSHWAPPLFAPRCSRDVPGCPRMFQDVPGCSTRVAGVVTRLAHCIGLSVPAPEERGFGFAGIMNCHGLRCARAWLTCRPKQCAWRSGGGVDPRRAVTRSSFSHRTALSIGYLCPGVNSGVCGGPGAPGRCDCRHGLPGGESRDNGAGCGGRPI